MAKVNLQEIKIKGQSFTWVNIIHPTELDTRQLARRFHFHPLDLKDVLPPIQRPKLLERDHYLFMILLFPVYHRETRRIHSVEVDFFIGNNFLVTVASEDLFPLRDFFVRCQKGKQEKEVCAAPTPAPLLYELLNRLRLYCFPMLVHVSNDIDRVEEEVFTGQDEKKTINEVLLIKTNIVNFRKSMNRHTRVLQQFLTKAPKFFSTEKLEWYFKDLVEHTADIWELLENYRDSINAIHESHLSLLNFRSNVISKTYTIFTACIFSITFLAALFGMRAQNLPIVNWPGAFWLILGLMLITILTIAVFFKHKKWI